MKSSPAASPPHRPEELVNICAPLSDRWATPAERKLPKEQTGLKCISPPIWRKKVHLPRGSRARDAKHPRPQLFLFIFNLSSSSSSSLFPLLVPPPHPPLFLLLFLPLPLLPLVFHSLLFLFLILFLSFLLLLFLTSLPADVCQGCFGVYIVSLLLPSAVSSNDAFIINLFFSVDIEKVAFMKRGASWSSSLYQRPSRWANDGWFSLCTPHCHRRRSALAVAAC